MKDSESNLKTFVQQCQQKQALRDRLEEMQAKLRNMQVNIEQEQVKNANLRNIKDAENQLRDKRNETELQLLNHAQDVQRESMKETQGAVTDIKKQDEQVIKMGEDLTKKMNFRLTNNVESLIRQIKHDMDTNSKVVTNLTSQLAQTEGNYLQFK